MARSSQGKKKAPPRAGGPKPNSHAPSLGGFAAPELGGVSEVGARPFALDLRSALIILGLVALTIATLWPVFLCKFINYDDPVWVTENHRVQQGLSLANIAWTFTQAYGYWTPIDVLSHMLDCQLFGLNPAGHHVTNLVIHVCNVVLLFLFLRGVTARPWCSALAAALFAVHPLNVEPVAWITGRKDVLSTFWAFLALLAYARYAAIWRARARGHWRPYLPVAILFMFSLMTKPAFLPFPVVLLFLDYWPLKRYEGLARNDFGPAQEGRKRIYGLLIEKVPLLCVAFAFVILDYVTQRHFGAILTEDAGLTARVANAANSYLMCLSKTVWPAILATPYPPRSPIALWKTALTLAVLAGITVSAVACRKRCPYLFVGWFWYGLILFPVCGLLVAIGDFAMADRYAYLSMIGPFVAVAWGLGEIARRAGARRQQTARIVVAGLSAVALLAFAAVARFQVSYWRDGETLFSHALAVDQESYVAFNNLGAFLLDQNRFEEAKVHLTKALQIRSTAEAHDNLGQVLYNEGNHEEAKSHFTKALELKPDYYRALSHLGALAVLQGHIEEGKDLFMKALKLKPDYVDALNNLGVAFANQDRREEAKAYFMKALEVKPDYADARNNLELLGKPKRISIPVVPQ